MLLQLVMVVVLALYGFASSAPGIRGSSTSQDRVVAQKVSGASAATQVLTSDSGHRSDGELLKDLDVVVPPVEPSDKVAKPDVPPQTQAAAGVVVADQLVTSNRVESEVVQSVGFQTLGVTWPENAKVGDLGGQVRTRTNGKWSGWVDLEPDDSAPDTGSAEAARSVRGGTDPVPIGNADAVQLAFTANAKGGPAGLSLALVGSAEKPVSGGVLGPTAVGSNAVSSVASGGAAIQTAVYSTAVQAVGPRVITRAQWGAPAQACKPDVAPALVGAAVHHTAGSNSYGSVAQAMQQIRNDAIYHIKGRGWCDLGYNFVVDKWGNIYEGRALSMTQAVVGAHAGGFNTGTVGVAMLGTYNAAPSAATKRSVAQIIGWRLGSYGVDPKTSMSYHTGGVAGDGARYHNQNVRLPRVFGHGQVWLTSCPAAGGYAALPSIRTMASTFSYPQRYAQAQSIVKALYQDLLLRPVDSSGLRAWSVMLAVSSGQPALVASLTRSREYVQLRVRQAYNQVLGRAPDSAGLAAWTREILAGRIPVDDVQRRFYASGEFVNRSGGTANGYVAGLYQTILGRAASQAEVDSLAPQVGNQAGRSKVTESIWFSMEAAKYRAGKYYLLFLKRTADPGGQLTWARVLLSKGEGAVRTGIAGSGEYRLLALKRYP